MKIALVGTHNCGKTTLWNLMKKDDLFKNHTFVKEQIREVNKMGFGINDSAGDVTQLVLALENQFFTLGNIDYFNNVVMDRCLLDNYIYALYLSKKSIVDKKVVSVIKDAWEKTLRNLNYVFWLRPEFGMNKDGQRSTDIDFQMEIDKLFEDYIKEHTELAYLFCELKGQSPERLVKLKRIVSGYDYY